MAARKDEQILNNKNMNYTDPSMNYTDPNEKLIANVYGVKSLVDHPSHYQGNGIEVIDIIEAFDLNFSLGNSIKYILRADKKGNKKQDIEKAIWYLNNELKKFNG